VALRGPRSPDGSDPDKSFVTTDASPPAKTPESRRRWKHRDGRRRFEWVKQREVETGKRTMFSSSGHRLGSFSTRANVRSRARSRHA
jgi:hypothetical protein